VLVFHAAYAWPQTGFLTVVYLFALVQLARADTWRKAFYAGLAVGMGISSVKLAFFWRIFSAGAIALWLVYAFWIGLFAILGRACLKKFPTPLSWFALPFVWIGPEYFRSELYYLRFSWLNPGMAFGLSPEQVPLRDLGIYGLSFVLMGIACGAAFFWQGSKTKAVLVLIAGVGGLRLWAALSPLAHQSSTQVQVAGVQMEFPTEQEVLLRLNELIRKYPKAELLVLSEYTFGEGVPQKILGWCREQAKYLVVGGRDPVSGNFYNTAYVISPEGKIIFRQAKSVPIQFFKDGLPAPEQRVWNSPWGKIGICICYDLSYSRVTDKLVELGAQALVVPTMDVADWGQRQHELHARVAPLRAAEYGVPVFRLASSGISQAVDRKGRVPSTAPCLGDGAMLSTTLELAVAGRRPLDRWFAPFATGITALLLLLFCIRSVLECIKPKELQIEPPQPGAG
jgi:apolipoprotein N-acyltransferase